jgi:hypothetical protein
MAYCRALARYRPSTIESILLQPFTLEGYINFHREICKVASKNERKFEVHLGNILYHICLRSSPKSSNPFHWHWGTVVITFNSEYIGFMSIVLASFTYAIEAYLTRVGPLVVMLCAMRGFFS